MTHFPLQNELSVAAFILAIWMSGHAMNYMRTSPLLGYIICGALIGPPLADIVPEAECFQLFGKIGVMLFVVEGGLQIEMTEIKAIGVRSFAAAFTGVAGPVLLALFYLMVIEDFEFKTALAAGASIAPTSFGFTARLFEEINELNTPLGKLVTISAIFDDVLSLILLSQVQALAKDESTTWDIIKPLVASLACIIVGVFLASDRIIPALLLRYTNYVRTVKSIDSKMIDQSLLLFLLILACLFALGCAAVESSELLGCFLAGIAFSNNKDIHRIWAYQLQRTQQLGLKLFFAATIGFSFPKLTQDNGIFSSGSIIGRGCALTFIAIIGKFLLCGFALPANSWSAKLKFGFAMNGRGEFSFLIADASFTDGLFTEALYSSVLFACLFSSFCSPVGFRAVTKFERKRGKTESDDGTTMPATDAVVPT